MSLLVWCCDPEAALHAQLVAATIEDQRAHELEEDQAIALALDPYEETDVRLEDAFYCELYYQNREIRDE